MQHLLSRRVSRKQEEINALLRRPVVGTWARCHSGVHISGRTELREGVRKGSRTGAGVVTAAVRGGTQKAGLTHRF